MTKNRLPLLITMVLLLSIFMQLISTPISYASKSQKVDIDKGVITINPNLLSVPNSVFVGSNNWTLFNWGGQAPTNKQILSGGYQGHNYIRLTGSGQGDSGVDLIVSGLSANTNYTVSGYVRVPQSGGTNFGNGLFFIVNGANNRGIAAFNPPATQHDWALVKGTFNTGSDTSIHFRMTRGNVPTVDVTMLKIEKGNNATLNQAYKNPVVVPFNDYNIYGWPSTLAYDSGGYTGTLQAKTITFIPQEHTYHHDPIYRTDYQDFSRTKTGTFSTNSNDNFQYYYPINENGYVGNITRQSVSWTTNWVRNRTVELTEWWTSTNYTRYSNQVSYPVTRSKTYYDSGTNKNYTFTLPKYGSPYSVNSSPITIYSESFGRAANYDRNSHDVLGYMSDNNSSYWSGTYRYSNAPRTPSDYYGPETDKTGWTLVTIKWDESSPQHARDWGYLTKSDNYQWKSDSSTGVTSYNYYRKGVYLKYKKTVTGYTWQQRYKDTVSLPDYIKNYSGTASYSGRLSKQVIDHYNDYYTSNKWKAIVNYEGTVYSRNLKAVSIDVVDSNNISQSHLVKGKQYKIKVVASNNGELNVGAFKIGYYANNTKLGTIDINSLAKGASTTQYFNYTATTAGTFTFKTVIDDANVIQETSETDNTIQVNKLVNTVPVITANYLPNPVFEGDDLKVNLVPTDADGDLLDVTLEQSKDYGLYTKVLDVQNTSSGTTHSYTLPKITPGHYDFRATVIDEHGDRAVVTLGLNANPLTIFGHVTHTPDWEAKHIQMNNPLSNFYSGEKFILGADVTNYPINSVTVTFNGIQENGNVLTLNKNLTTATPIYYAGDLYDPSMTEPSTKLKDGQVIFTFKVTYKNGVVKTHNVPVNIIGSVYDAFYLYRTY